jgi:hypothetical protein
MAALASKDMEAMSKLFCCILALSCITSLGVAAEFGKPITFSNGNSATTPSSVVALLGNPKRWDGKAVSVVGFIGTDLHGVFLFMSSELCKAWATEYAVLVKLDTITPPTQYTDLPETPCALASVEGHFFEMPREKPKPNVFIIRDLPAWIEAKYVVYK